MLYQSSLIQVSSKPRMKIINGAGYSVLHLYGLPLGKFYVDNYATFVRLKEPIHVVGLIIHQQGE